MIKEEVLKLNQAFSILGKCKECSKNMVRFRHTLSKNSLLIEPEVKSLQEANKFSKEILEYNKLKLELLEKYSNKDDDGKGKKVEVQPGLFQYDLGDNLSLYTEELNKLNVEYLDYIKVQENQEKQYLELLKETINIELIPFELDWLPNDLDQPEMNLLTMLNLIKE